MRLKLDENMPSLVARLLRVQGHDVHTAGDENLLGANDSDVWRAAQAEGRAVITMDLDYGLLAETTSGHFGLAILRLDDPRAPVITAIATRVTTIVPADAWRGRTIIADEQRLRFRPPVVDPDDFEDLE
jgi:predicted nuclease of predicted toxin-antitoxin system